MIRECVVYVILIAAFFVFSPAIAAVHVTDDLLSVHVSQVALADVLTDISRQGRIAVIGLEHDALHTTVISETFQDLAIETGLERLLAGFDYAFTRQPITGRIGTLYLLPKRENASVATSLSTQTSQIAPPLPDKDPQSLLPHERGDTEEFISSLIE